MATLGSPVHPGQVGTFSFASSLNARYTVGREAAVAAVRVLAEREDCLALDIEGEGLDELAMRIKVVTIGTATHAVVLDPRDPPQFAAIRDALAAARVLVVHNAPFDVPILVRHGLMSLADVGKVKDTLVYCRLAEPDERTAKSLLMAGHRYLGTDKEDVLTGAFKAVGFTKAAGFKAFDLDRPIYVQGAAFDVILAARLYPVVRKAAYERLTKHPFATWGVSGADADALVEREQTINQMFIRRAARGLRVDIERLDSYRASVMAQQDADAAVLAEAGITPGHGASLTTWLEERGLLPADHPRTAKTGAPQATKGALDVLDHPMARTFVRHKEVKKVLVDYLQKVVNLADEHDRIHPTTAILGAATGRMSMSGPPLQQFPDAARGIVLADEGDALTSIDWSQIEPVVAANMAKDTKVLSDYESQGRDLYETVAELAGGITRKKAKTVLLAQMYGEGMTKLSLDLGITMEQAWDLRDAIMGTMPRVKRLIKKLRDVGESHRLVFTLSGRIVPIPSGQYGVAVHKAVNYFVQGSAYDVLADSLIRIDQAGLGDAVYLAMHDELVVSTEAAHDVRKIMEEPPDRLCRMAGRTPVLRTDRADLGERWAAA